jgi:hypothetical protein
METKPLAALAVTQLDRLRTEQEVLGVAAGLQEEMEERLLGEQPCHLLEAAVGAGMLQLEVQVQPQLLPGQALMGALRAHLLEGKEA